jgi:hypothetical protein
VVVALERAVAVSNCGKCDLFSESAPSQWFALAVKPRSDKAVARTIETKGFPTFLSLYAVNRLPIVITPGVTQILGSGKQPNPVDEAEIISFQKAIKARVKIEPFPFLQAGQKVRVFQGALTGIEWIVVSCKEYLRLIVSITLLQRSVLLEIDRVQVETLSAPGVCWPKSPVT